MAASAARTLMESVTELLTRDGCVLQPSKCGDMASTPALRQHLRRAMAGSEVPVRLHCRDLGVDSAPGLRRTAVQKQRLAKGAARASRLRKLGIPGAKAGTNSNMLVKSAA